MKSIVIIKCNQTSDENPFVRCIPSKRCFIAMTISFPPVMAFSNFRKSGSARYMKITWYSRIFHKSMELASSDLWTIEYVGYILLQNIQAFKVKLFINANEMQRRNCIKMLQIWKLFYLNLQISRIFDLLKTSIHFWILEMNCSLNCARPGPPAQDKSRSRACFMKSLITPPARRCIGSRKKDLIMLNVIFCFPVTRSSKKLERTRWAEFFCKIQCKY